MDYHTINNINKISPLAMKDHSIKYWALYAHIYDIMSEASTIKHLEKLYKATKKKSKTKDLEALAFFYEFQKKEILSGAIHETSPAFTSLAEYLKS